MHFVASCTTFVFSASPSRPSSHSIVVPSSSTSFIDQAYSSFRSNTMPFDTAGLPYLFWANNLGLPGNCIHSLILSLGLRNWSSNSYMNSRRACFVVKLRRLLYTPDIGTFARAKAMGGQYIANTSYVSAANTLYGSAAANAKAAVYTSFTLQQQVAKLNASFPLGDVTPTTSTEASFQWGSVNTTAVGVHMASLCAMTSDSINRSPQNNGSRSYINSGCACSNADYKIEAHTFVDLNTTTHMANLHTINGTPLESSHSAQEHLPRRRCNLVHLNRNIGTRHLSAETSDIRGPRTLLANITHSASENALGNVRDNTGMHYQ
ncbi:hypothetical protein Tco_0587628 [Tanacetum coccineum]